MPVALAAEVKSAAPAPAVTLGATLGDGDLNPQTASFNSQLTLMLRAAQRGYEIPDGLASCQTLAKEANESGLGALFVDEGGGRRRRVRRCSTPRSRRVRSRR